MSKESPWWKVWDCDVHRSCSSIQHALIALVVMAIFGVALFYTSFPGWLMWVYAVIVSAVFGWREETQQSGFWGRRHKTTRGKWDARRDWLYPTVAAFAAAAYYTQFIVM